MADVVIDSGLRSEEQELQSREEADSGGAGRALFVEGWEFMQTLGEGAYSE